MYTGVISGIILIISLSIITSAPIAEQNYYDSIVLKCPLVGKIPEYKNQTLFTSCKPINVLQNVTTLSPETFVDVLCLMYYNSVTSVCNQSTLPNDILLPQKTDLKVEDVCKNFSRIGELTNGLINPEECLNKCNVFNITKEICILSHKLVHAKKEITENVNNNNNAKQEISVLPTKINKTEVPKAQMSLANKKTQVDEPNHPLNKINKTHSSTTEKIKENHQTTVNVASKEEPITKQESAELTPPDLEAIKESVNPKTQLQPINTDSQPLVPAPGFINSVDPNEKVPSSIDQEAQKSSTNTPTSYVIPDNLEELSDPNAMQFNIPDDEQDNESQEEEKKLAVKSKNVEGSNISSDDLDGDSYFFSYFMVICLMVVLGYVAYHNRQKLFALMIEGKKNKRQNRGRRPNSANYHKLDSNLEEAITSDCSKSTSHIIY